MVDDWRRLGAIALDRSGSPLDVTQVRVHLHDSNSQTLPAKMPEDVRAFVDSVWAAKLREHPRMYNALKFRFQGHHHVEEQVPSSSPVKVVLELGFTDYKHNIASLRSQEWTHLLDAKKDPKLWPNILGCSVIVETSDGLVVVQKRSNNVAEYPNTYAFIGGHPEPKHVGVECDLDGTTAFLANLRNENTEALNTSTAQELFKSAHDEVHEELGIPGDALGPARLLGVADRLDSHRFVLVFVLRTIWTSDQIRANIHLAVDAFETSELHFYLPSALVTVAPTMTGCSQAAFFLYNLQL